MKQWNTIQLKRTALPFWIPHTTHPAVVVGNSRERLTPLPRRGKKASVITVRTAMSR